MSGFIGGVGDEVVGWMPSGVDSGGECAVAFHVDFDNRVACHNQGASIVLANVDLGGSIAIIIAWYVAVYAELTSICGVVGIVENNIFIPRCEVALANG